MPALDIDCCQQVKMATVAPEAALEAAALATLKRTCISSSGNSNNGNQSNEPANVLSKLNASLQQHQQHQPLKKRRLANALLTPTTSLKSASTHSSLSSSSSTSQRPDHNQYHYAAAAAAIAHSHSNGDISTGFNGSDDLTNLNWLQDANLLKSIYSSGPSVDSSSDASSSAQAAAAAATGDFVIAQRRPPLNNQQNHPHHQQHPPLHRKPPYSYSALIFLAIESSPSKSMMVRDIYAWIVQNFPFFATAPAGWKNTIRHTLSLRKCFKKVDRCTGAEIAAGDSDSDSGDNKGGLWHVDDEYRATLQQLVARAQQNVLPKLVMSGRRISATERVLLPKKKVTHWGGTGRGGSGKGRWPLKTTPLGDVHYLQNGKQHNGAEAAAAVMPVMPGQKFIQVPVIRSFFPHRYHPHPLPHPYPHHHHHHRVNRCQPPAAMTQADVRTSAEAQGCEAASYKLQLMTLNKLNSSSSSSSHGGHTHRSTAHIPRRPPAISAAAARNSVSVISVNQAPKVYAPVPKVTMASCGGGSVEKPIAASNHHQHYHYHNYHYLHQPPAPSQPSSPVACLQPLSNAKDALSAAPHLQKFLPSSKKPAAAAEKHKAQSSAVMTAAAAASVAGISSSPHIVCPPSYNHHHHHLHHCHYQPPPPPPQSTGNSVFVKKFLLSPSDDDDEEEDMLIRDGAEALLNFASSAFSLNRLIKQED